MRVQAERTWSKLRQPVLFALAAVALLASVYGRVVPAWRTVMVDGQVRLLDTDSYYHLRHTLFSAEHFPLVERWDVGTHFPLGERSPHAGFFNQCLAAVALLASGGQVSRSLLTHVLAWAPVALHVVAMIVLFRLARRLMNLSHATLAVGIFALFPGLALPKTFLGFADHHAAEIVLLLGTAWGLVASLEYHAGGPRVPPATRWGRALRILGELRFAVPLLVFQFTWTGAPLAVGLAALALAVVAATDLVRDGEGYAVSRTALDTGVVLVVGMLLARLLWPDAILMLELLTPLVGASAALAASGLLGLWLFPRLGWARGEPRVALGIIALVCLLGVVALCAIPEKLTEMVLETKSDTIQEQQGVSWLGFLELHGLFGALALASPLVLIQGALRTATLRPHVATCAFTTLLTAQWLMIHDYGYGPPALLALCCSLAIWRLLHQSSRRWLAPMLFGFGALQIWPAKAAHNPFTSVPTSLLLVNQGWFEAMRWLRSSTPRPQLAVDARVTPWVATDSPFPDGSYGVLAAWEFGNFVSALGERTPVRSHGMSTALARWLLSPSEEDSLAGLCPECSATQRVAYVVLSAPTVAEHFVTTARVAAADVATYQAQLGELDWHGQRLRLESYGERYDRTISARLYNEDANGLTRYRLVYESAHQSLLSYRTTLGDGASPNGASFIRVSTVLDTPAQLADARALLVEPLRPIAADSSVLYDHHVTSSVKIFEVVAGARLEGMAWPGSRVTVFLGLRVLSTGRELVYRQQTLADEQGQFHFVFPYSSVGGSNVVVASAPLQLLASAPAGQQQVVTFEVPEQAVQTNRLMRLGDVRAPSTVTPTDR